MKKVILFLSVLILLLYTPCVLATDGVYVPSYSSFMESFSAKMKDINTDLWETISEECLVDGEWIEPDTNLNYLPCYSVSTDLRITEGNGFLNTITISLPKDKLSKEETLFKETAIAAATSIILNTDEAFEQSFFNNIHYDYAMESPAGYISLYWNCGVYCFNFTKSSSDIELKISLSVYEAE